MRTSEERSRLGAPGSHSAVAPECPSSADHQARCVTCGDAARWMYVLEVDAARELAVCADEEERRHTVDTGIAGAVACGERLLVHAGAALLKESA